MKAPYLLLKCRYFDSAEEGTHVISVNSNRGKLLDYMDLEFMTLLTAFLTKLKLLINRIFKCNLLLLDM